MSTPPGPSTPQNNVLEPAEQAPSTPSEMEKYHSGSSEIEKSNSRQFSGTILPPALGHGHRRTHSSARFAPDTVEPLHHRVTSVISGDGTSGRGTPRSRRSSIHSRRKVEMEIPPKPHNTQLQQQMIPSFQPRLSTKYVLSCLFLITASFIPIGASMIVASDSVS